MKKPLMFLLALVPSVALAGQDDTASFAILYEIDSTDPIYCRLTGQSGDPFGPGISGTSRIETSGSSTTTTAVTAASGPFASVSAGDILLVRSPVDDSTLVRRVVSKADSDTVTVHTAWNLSGGFAFTWKKLTCGTAATSGWIEVGNADSFAITFELDQVSVTGGINVQVQCRTGAINASPVQIFPACTSGACNTVQNYTTAGVASATTVAVGFPYKSCRVGVDIGTADDGSDTGNDAEQIDISVTRHLSTR